MPRPTRHALTALGVPLLLAAVVMASAPGWVTIRVRSGDTLSEIAVKHHTTVAALVALNRLPGNGHLIYAGQTLKVPGAAARATTTTRTVDRVHVVRSGDSLFGIAARYHVDWHVIAKRNHLPSSLVVRLGQHLVVPQRVTTTTATGTSTHYPSAVSSSAARHRAQLAARTVASRSEARRMIRSTAAAFGVDPALALAVAYQESGFNQRVVSAVDAIGVMQVLPSTGDYVSRYVVGRHLDLLSTRDNVVAGVALLSVLTRAAKVDVAVAGYYQGLASVRSRGMYADTKRYVRNVLALRARFR